MLYSKVIQLHMYSFSYILQIFFLFPFIFFKLWKHDNTITRDLENMEQNYI